MNCNVKITKPDAVGYIELGHVVQALVGYSWHIGGSDYSSEAIAKSMKSAISRLMRAGSRADDAFEVSVDDDGNDQVTVSFTVAVERVAA
ncbi:hypothetical protein ASF69_01530 [Rhizobium sp. Leaf311]|uniref:hypothetical protein n=1 Tax=Rhizobium sp. Leaf311 TaxID=1736332 RepID=UPI0007135831|nr:hypothetical protein [Rhizobium sp. Leaf311]KQQ61131.1 hypothetical protein ASF69_01530 [Rhizobium sp. Leaf311]